MVKQNNYKKCFYCKKHGHKTWIWRPRANDILKGKLKEDSHKESNFYFIKDDDTPHNGEIINTYHITSYY